MSRFTRFSGRRKVLLALVFALLALVGAMSWLGVAGLRGTEARDMDWNGDGQVSRAEMFQAYTSVVVSQTREGNRVCRSYARLRDRGNAIRVDCRTEAAPAATDD